MPAVGEGGGGRRDEQDPFLTQSLRGRRAVKSHAEEEYTSTTSILLERRRDRLEREQGERRKIYGDTGVERTRGPHRDSPRHTHAHGKKQRHNISYVVVCIGKGSRAFAKKEQWKKTLVLESSTYFGSEFHTEEVIRLNNAKLITSLTRANIWKHLAP